LLLADGELISPAADEHSGGEHLLVLSRELCRFHFFAALAGAPRKRTEAAAELYCESHAPFEASDSVKLRTPSGVAIWTWDRHRIEALLAGRRPYVADRILPESLLNPMAEGWRQCALLAGYEAQYWRQGALVASTWRRRPFDREEWQVFAESVLSPTTPAPEDPPEPEAFPLPLEVRSMPRRVPRHWGRREAERAAFAAALILAAFGSYAQGLAGRFDRLAERNAVLIASEESAARANAESRRVANDLAVIRAFQQLARLRAPLEATADVFGMLGTLGLNAGEWKVDDAGLELHIVPAPDLALVRDLAQLIEDHPAFGSVSSQTAGPNEGHLIEATVEGAAPHPAATTS
jgi:hypothetical protein